MKRELLFDEDPLTATKEHFVMEDGSDQFQIITEQVVDPILGSNQESRKPFDAKSPWKGDMHRVASIPTPLFMELQRKGITKNPKEFRKWLNDPENAVFRTRPGRV